MVRKCIKPGSKLINVKNLPTSSNSLEIPCTTSFTQIFNNGTFCLPHLECCLGNIFSKSSIPMYNFFPPVDPAFSPFNNENWSYPRRFPLFRSLVSAAKLVSLANEAVFPDRVQYTQPSIMPFLPCDGTGRLHCSRIFFATADSTVRLDRDRLLFVVASRKAQIWHGYGSRLLPACKLLLIFAKNRCRTGTRKRSRSIGHPAR